MRITYNIDVIYVFKCVKQLEYDVEELITKDLGIVLRPDKSVLITARKIKLKHKLYQM